MLFDKHNYRVDHAFINISFNCIPQILKANKFRLNPEEIDGFKYSLKCCNRYTNKNYPWFGEVVMCLSTKKLLKNKDFTVKFVKNEKNHYKLYILSNTTDIIENITNYIDEFIVNYYSNINYNTYINYNVVKRRCTEKGIKIKHNIMKSYKSNDSYPFSISINNKIEILSSRFNDIPKEKIKNIVTAYGFIFDNLRYKYFSAAIYINEMIQYNCLFYPEFIMPGYDSYYAYEIDSFVNIICNHFKHIEEHRSDIYYANDLIVQQLLYSINQYILDYNFNIYNEKIFEFQYGVKDFHVFSNLDDKRNLESIKNFIIKTRNYLLKYNI